MSAPKFKVGDRVRATRVFVVQSTDVDEIGQIPVGRGRMTASIHFRPEDLELVDDPASDPVGTVRKCSVTGGVWVLMPSGMWSRVSGGAPHEVRTGEQVRGMDIIGAVPGTPAAEERG